MLRRLLPLIMLGAVAVAAPAAAHGPALRQVVARYSFDGAGDGVMVAHGTVKMAPGAVFVLTSVDLTSPNQPTVFFPDVIDLDPQDGVRSYGAVGQHTLCVAPLTCTVHGDTFTFGVSYGVNGNGRTPLHIRFYLAARGATVSLHDGALIGWKARHLTSGLVTRTDRDAAGAGADVETVDAGLMTSVSAPGPRGGSVAIAVPGCDVTGAGLLTLAGGTRSATTECPSGPVGAMSATKTTWDAHGAVAGISQNQTRLVVLPR